ncbi:purine/pyrimidine phosphoribosyltransferase [Helicobacter mustelae]|uniref:Possible purine/pyrimidine phosphoribosyltransferase n=1 Tax=Helicobacter mustelae (strain ATCC 43772 / CCUG 25715 / CIP 103759 / LMG 18044 / NCTC 12198 / R85-136P) TaxID=679897 RepID=D3UGC0_HELM1|nr:purine/pyrimidine phosphoribosyltransferase [Helicobacter mustelae]CBG39541.1 possible purine/pyrimidine phosphoribosyltransferase [Helicobacter mustelae 12198]SQH71053.1 purine/pyrimidine phosphoribosyltransferase [Helicobacter mustelae]STP12182.1 purine/pyrimidine phosphoribosyltransferase [Helicobacter mustelae]
MRCIVCARFSLCVLCKSCQEQHLILKPKIRIIGDFKVYSFYDYQDVSFLLATKYYAIGTRVFALLAGHAARYFFTQQKSTLLSQNVYGIAIDDHPKKSYSHSGVILRAFRHCVRPIYGELYARNAVQYAGKNLEFRKNHPKDFFYKSGARDVVIFDDIITTGTSMLEASSCVQKAGGQALFGIVLADARY